jgi:hypothetical protein
LCRTLIQVGAVTHTGRWTHAGGIRKHLMTVGLDCGAAEATGSAAARDPARSPLDLGACTTIRYSSEDPSHPIEHLMDEGSGAGAPRWVSGRWDETEQIVFEFDEPQHISRVDFEVEEAELERTQQVMAEYSSDGGETYRLAFSQEYTFSPPGSIYQRESLNVELRAVTHFRLTIVPNKCGSGKATLTSLRLFSW